MDKSVVIITKRGDDTLPNRVLSKTDQIEKNDEFYIARYEASLIDGQGI